jgi:spermidine synthase
MKEYEGLHLLFKEISLFNEITVYDTTHLHGKMGKYRCLQFADDAIQGAIDLKDRNRIVLEYARAIIHVMEFNNSSFENVFVIGQGSGTIAGHYPAKQFKVAEIDSMVVEISRLYFSYLQDNVVVGDGRQILWNEQPNTYDYIILDAFTHKGTPLQFTTKEFFELAQEKLNFQGAIIMNVMGKPNNDRLINAIHSTLKETFMYTKAFSLSVVEEADIRNMIIMGSNKTIDFEARDMAGFYEIEIGQGHIIMDSTATE